jgi:membrane protease YdiL (CAAX protease family)
MSKSTFTDKRLWIFFALTYGLSWLFWIPAALSGRDFTVLPWLIPFILGGFGPSVAGIIMTYRSRDKRGRRDFWRRVIDLRRISAGWYLFILSIFPALLAIGFLLNSLLGTALPDFETLARNAANPLTLVGMVVIGIITGPLSEELGWRGFALDRLQVRWSPLVSSLILAPFWWGWHLPLFFMPGTTQYRWGFGTPSFWLFTIGIVPLSILLTWSYNQNRRSILAAVLLHFGYNFFLDLAQPLSTTVYVFHVILLFITALGLVVFYRSRP